MRKYVTGLMIIFGLSLIAAAQSGRTAPPTPTPAAAEMPSAKNEGFSESVPSKARPNYPPSAESNKKSTKDNKPQRNIPYYYPSKIRSVLMQFVLGSMPFCEFNQDRANF